MALNQAAIIIVVVNQAEFNQVNAPTCHVW